MIAMTANEMFQELGYEKEPDGDWIKDYGNKSIEIRLGEVFGISKCELGEYGFNEYLCFSADEIKAIAKAIEEMENEND